MENRLYITPFCEVIQLGAEASLCTKASGDSSIEGFSAVDIEYGLFGN